MNKFLIFKKVIISLSIILFLSLTVSCSATYERYSSMINGFTSPTELFKVDQELRFLDITYAEKNTLKKALSKKGLPIMVQYTKGMLEGHIILDKNLIYSMRDFIDKYIGYANTSGKDIYLEVLVSLEDLLKLVKIYEIRQEDIKNNIQNTN